MYYLSRATNKQKLIRVSRKNKAAGTGEDREHINIKEVNGDRGQITIVMYFFLIDV